MEILYGIRCYKTEELLYGTDPKTEIPGDETAGEPVGMLYESHGEAEQGIFTLFGAIGDQLYYADPLSPEESSDYVEKIICLVTPPD